MTRDELIAVLKDLMQPSEAKLVVNEVLRARAREIGVEID